MKSFPAAAAAGAALFACAPSSAATKPPVMELLIRPTAMSEAKGGAVDVTVAIPGLDVAAGEPILTLGAGAPGMPTPQPVEDMTIVDDEGAVAAALKDDKGDYRWTAARRVHGKVTARYRLPIDNARGSNPPVALHVDGDTFSAPGRMLLAAPQTKTLYRLAVRWDVSAMGAGAVGISSFGDGDAEGPPLPPQRLVEVAFAAGHFHREPEEASNGFSALWGGEPPFDPRPLMHWTGELHRWMSGFFHDTKEPPYRVILRANPQNPGGGVAYFQAFVVGYGDQTTAEGLKRIFGHEMTHTWTAAGEDIGKWYNEGNAVYYQSLLPWRAGLITTEQRLADINATASRYYTNPRKDATEAYALVHFWEDTRVRVLPYDRGALYFAVLNGQVRKASGGKRSIDDLIREMVGLYRSGAPMSEEVWVGVLRREIGEPAVATHRSMMSGGFMLPESDAYGPCFRRVVAKIRPLDLGFDWSSLKSGVITGLKPDSEAAKAGVREGDKTTYRGPGDVDQQDVTRKITVRVVRDGQTVPITYLPRGEAVDAYQWERVPGVPESACKG